jgi:repressor LexA
MKLTKKQSEILQYITKCLQEQGYPPTIREIAERFSLESTGTVRDHLKALTDKGFIKRIPGVSRGLKLIKTELLPSNSVFIPIVGHISAGGPKLAFEDIRGNLAVDKTIITAEGTFALRVEGDSMMGKGIFKGDYVVIKPQPIAQNGDVVVALIDDEEATVKEFRRKNGVMQLVPANPIYQPIDVDERVKIIGRVVGLIRKF